MFGMRMASFVDILCSSFGECVENHRVTQFFAKPLGGGGKTGSCWSAQKWKGSVEESSFASRIRCEVPMSPSIHMT